jgi:hypothetical protein
MIMAAPLCASGKPRQSVVAQAGAAARRPRPVQCRRHPADHPIADPLKPKIVDDLCGEVMTFAVRSAKLSVNDLHTGEL